MDKDLKEVFKRTGKSMSNGSSAKDAERDAELVELRLELKELRSQLKANSQVDQDEKSAPGTVRREHGEDK